MMTATAIMLAGNSVAVKPLPIGILSALWPHFAKADRSVSDALVIIAAATSMSIGSDAAAPLIENASTDEMLRAAAAVGTVSGLSHGSTVTLSDYRVEPGALVRIGDRSYRIPQLPAELLWRIQDAAQDTFKLAGTALLDRFVNVVHQGLSPTYPELTRAELVAHLDLPTAGVIVKCISAQVAAVAPVGKA
jgi:hypothetical protein